MLCRSQASSLINFNPNPENFFLLKMYSKTLLVSALLALSVVSAAPVPAEKRCLGGCKTTNDSSTKTDTNVNTK